jgi:hypothetical protein
MNSTVQHCVRSVVQMLVAGDYNKVAALTKGRRLDAEAIKFTVGEYGRTLVLPPDDAFDQMDVVRVTNAPLPQWSVRMNLWTLEEGQSDLSIELTIIDSAGHYEVELDDIRVL